MKTLSKFMMLLVLTVVGAVGAWAQDAPTFGFQLDIESTEGLTFTVTLGEDAVDALSAGDQALVTVEVAPESNLDPSTVEITAKAYVEAGDAQSRRRVPVLKNIELTKTDDLAWSFTMPAANVVFKLTADPQSLIDLSQYFLVVDGAFVYNGEAHEPGVKFTDISGMEVDIPSDAYTLSYEDNINAGIATVKADGVTAKGYNGQAQGNFTIDKALLSSAELNYNSLPYTGEDQISSFQVTQVLDENNNVVSPTEYEFSFAESEVINAGDYWITISPVADGNYEGSIGNVVEITPVAITEVQLKESTKTATNPATPLTFEIESVKAGDLTLTEADYTYDPSQLTQSEPNNYTFTVTAVTGGNFTGAKEVSFTILDPDAAILASISVDPEEYTYTGSAITPTSVIVQDGGATTLEEGTDYTLSYADNTNVGQATVNAIGQGAYEASLPLTANFTIVARNINDDYVIVEDIADVTYDGTAKEPTLRLRIGDKNLVLGTDYTVSYSNNIDAGQATATITAVDGGNFRGTKDVDFRILPATITSATLKETNKTYTGEELTFEVEEVKAGTLTLTADDYTVSGEKATEANNYTATITAVDGSNFTGTTTAAYSILTADASLLTLTVAPQEIEYTGSEIIPETIRVTNADGEEVGEDEGYDLTITNNVNVGDALVTIQGKDNYEGTQTATFKIIAKPFDSSWITVAPAGDYQGESLEPELTIIDDLGNELVEGIDFTAEYKDNVDAGTATVNITAMGNYSGTGSTTYAIAPAEITSRMVEYLYWKYYNGKEWRPVLRIIYNDVLLIEGRDYAVAYKNNTEATTATCVITGLGNFTGKCIKNFAIRRITLDKVTVASVDATTEKLTYGGMTLVKGKDYTVTRKDGIAYFSGEGNYFGDLEVKFGSADSGSDETATAPGDDATAINGVESAAAAEEWYTVNGVKLAAKPSKPGIYVVNGAKVVLK